MVDPDAGKAVRLQLRADGVAFRAGVTTGLQDAFEVLDVMAVFVGDDVRLRQRTTLGSEPRLELIEEPEVDVDRLIGRAVERPDCRAGGAAAGGDAVRVQEQLRGAIGLAGALVFRCPVGLDAVHEPDDPAIRTRVRVGAGLALGEE